MKKRIFLLLAVALLCVGCANRNKQLTKVMESWMGHDIKEVVASWGPPASVYDESSELKVYVWEKQRTMILPAADEGLPSLSLHKTDYRMFWVNQEGKVVRWRFGTK